MPLNELSGMGTTHHHHHHDKGAIQNSRVNKWNQQTDLILATECYNGDCFDEHSAMGWQVCLHC